VGPLTPYDVKRWDLDAIQQVFETANGRANTLQLLGDPLTWRLRASHSVGAAVAQYLSAFAAACVHSRVDGLIKKSVVDRTDGG
jgi:hypothetical protein